MNERQTLNVKNGRLKIAGLDCEDLVNQYGSPLYVLDVKHVEDMCKTFTDALNNYYGFGMVSYASKAFCCKEIYRIIKTLGLGADVVSAGELFTALSVDFPADKLIFHGNNKSLDELNMLVNTGVKYSVIDSIDEAQRLNDICLAKNKVQDVLIRVNPGVEAHTHEFIQTAKVDSKFGFSTQNGQALEFIEKILKLKNLNLVGLHCHIGSQIFEDKSFVLAVEKMTDFYKRCYDLLGLSFSVLDVGGGFGIYYSGDDPKLTLKDYDGYVKSICNTLLDCVSRKGIKKPYLILEPGRSIVGEAGITLYKVGSVKKIKDVKNYLAIDGGMFENPRFALYQAKYCVVSPLKMNVEPTEKYSIAGKCCESGDLIAENVFLPETEVGDILAVLSTGAYNYSMASNYNRNLIPAVIAVKNGESKIIVNRQTYHDLIRNDV